jgi:hypothetical protein
MGAGRRAAKAIGAYLQGGKQKWPITQEDADAFVPPVALGGAAPVAVATESKQSESQP